MDIKKVIDGAVYNTETAKMICEQFENDVTHQKGADIKQLKQLFRKKSGKYFFYIKNEFETYIATNNDDLNPEFELEEVEENKVLPVTYESSVQFASEVMAQDPGSKKQSKHFFLNWARRVWTTIKKFKRSSTSLKKPTGVWRC